MPVDAAERSRLYARSRYKFLRLLDVDPATGLTSGEATERSGIYGVNQLTRQKRRSTLSLLTDQFRRVIFWLLSAAILLSLFVDDVPEAVAIIVVLVINTAIAAGLPAPLIPLQILFQNIVTDVFTAFALGLGEGDRSVMKRPPRDPKEQIVGSAQWADIVALGSLITVAMLGAFWVSLGPYAMPPGEAVTIAFLTLAISQLWKVFNLRGRHEGLF